MVLGLGGAALPPRRLKPRPQQAQQAPQSHCPLQPEHTACLARVQSNSHLVLPLVGTPSSVPPAPQRACQGSHGNPQQPAHSDQSDVRGSSHGVSSSHQRAALGQQQEQREGQRQDRQQQGQGGGQGEVQSPPPSAFALLAAAAAKEAAAEAATALVAAKPAARAGASSRKRKPASPADAPPGGGTGSGQGGSRASRSRDTGTAAAATVATAAAAAAGTEQPAASGGDGAGAAPAASARTRSSTPAGKRHKSSSTPAKGAAAVSSGGGRKYGDVLHRLIEVPAAIFYIDAPGTSYVGRVTKAEAGRRVPSVEMQFLDDASRYWFPVEDVRAWAADMQRRGSWQAFNKGAPPPAHADTAAAGCRGPEGEEQVAAEALQSLSASLTSSRREAQARSKAPQPAVSSGGPQQRRGQTVLSAALAAAAAAAAVGADNGGCQMQRSGSELQRRGALDIMAVAAGQGWGCGTAVPQSD